MEMFVPIIRAELWPLQNDEPCTEYATDASGYNGKGNSEKAGYDPCLNFSQLGSALEKYLVDGHHASADVIWSIQLADSVADDGADCVCGTHQD